jgi:uncharacterized protein
VQVTTGSYDWLSVYIDRVAPRRLEDVLTRYPRRIVACSGGVDSLLLATAAHRASPSATLVAHAVTPAVPAAATERVCRIASEHGWSLRLVETSEFGDDRYLSNPSDRCYFCKDHLYSALDLLARGLDLPGWTTLSGANIDDLGEYRPGLAAAAEHEVGHPFIEAGIGKDGIRAMARQLGLPFADLPASPCLASRLYTGTRVTPPRLRAVEAGEQAITARTGVTVVRCRLRGTTCFVEVVDRDRPLITGSVLEEVQRVMVAVDPEVSAVLLDDRAYRPGRAITLR